MSNLATALAKAQAEMKNAHLNKVNPHFKSKYADLSGIRDTVVPVLTKHGIAVTQTTHVEAGWLVLDTALRMEDEAIVGNFPIAELGRLTPQQIGSATTYARRYALAAIACISADEDDDANAAEEGAKTMHNTRSKSSGPLTLTDLKAKLRGLSTDLSGIEDSDSLEALVLGAKSIIEQCQRDLPDWWLGTEDATGLKDRIAAMRKEFDNPNQAPKISPNITPETESWIVQFKEDVSVRAETAVQVRTIWTEAKNEIDALKRESPLAYADLVAWLQALVSNLEKAA